jgi:hypothetical protein
VALQQPQAKLRLQHQEPSPGPFQLAYFLSVLSALEAAVVVGVALVALVVEVAV